MQGVLDYPSELRRMNQPPIHVNPSRFHWEAWTSHRDKSQDLNRHIDRWRRPRQKDMKRPGKRSGKPESTESDAESKAPDSKKHTELAHDMRDALNVSVWVVILEGKGRSTTCTLANGNITYSVYSTASTMLSWRVTLPFQVLVILTRSCPESEFISKLEVVPQLFALPKFLWFLVISCSELVPPFSCL